MFRRLYLSIMLVSLVACAVQKPDVHSFANAKSIRNSDIRWDGNTLGLHPDFSGASKKILNDRSADFDDLVRALDDKTRYVAAHALLSMLTGYQIEMQSGGIDPLTGKLAPGSEEAFGKFNGLRVDLFADGKVVIPDNQQTKLAAKWKAWLRSKK